MHKIGSKQTKNTWLTDTHCLQITPASKKVALLQIVGLFIYILNMYNLFDSKSGITELQTREDKVLAYCKAWIEEKK